MPNLMLTNWCNYSCRYCFGMDVMTPKVKAQAMMDETFLGILDWLERTNYRSAIHLMGGEPTLHPKFEWIVSTLLQRNLPVVIFSNLATENAPVFAEKLSSLPVSWIVNVNSPAGWSDVQKTRIESALGHLKNNATLSLNVMPDEDNGWALSLIEKFGLNKRIKIGFVLPTVKNTNYSLTDSEYAVVAEKVTCLAQDADEMGIRLEYECGIPTCAFTAKQLGILWKCGSALRSGCCSRLDITPDGHLIYCLPLSTITARPYTDFPDYDTARRWYEESLIPYRRLGRKFECATCNNMNPLGCNGACLARNNAETNNIKIL